MQTYRTICDEGAFGKVAHKLPSTELGAWACPLEIRHFYQHLFDVTGHGAPSSEAKADACLRPP